MGLREILANAILLIVAIFAAIGGKYILMEIGFARKDEFLSIVFFSIAFLLALRYGARLLNK